MQRRGVRYGKRVIGRENVTFFWVEFPLLGFLAVPNHLTT
jgi:hypothetical protein